VEGAAAVAAEPSELGPYDVEIRTHGAAGRPIQFWFCLRGVQALPAARSYPPQADRPRGHTSGTGVEFLSY